MDKKKLYLFSLITLFYSKSLAMYQGGEVLGIIPEGIEPATSISAETENIRGDIETLIRNLYWDTKCVKLKNLTQITQMLSAQLNIDELDDLHKKLNSIRENLYNINGEQKDRKTSIHELFDEIKQILSQEERFDSTEQRQHEQFISNIREAISKEYPALCDKPSIEMIL